MLSNSRKWYTNMLSSLTIYKEKYLREIIKDMGKQIKSLKLDEDHRKEFEWNVHRISNQAIDSTIRNEQSLELLKAMFFSILTPEQKEAMMKQFPQIATILPQPASSSSLPLENKIVRIDNKDEIIRPADQSNSDSNNGNNRGSGGTQGEQKAAEGNE